MTMQSFIVMNVHTHSNNTLFTAISKWHFAIPRSTCDYSGINEPLVTV